MGKDRQGFGREGRLKGAEVSRRTTRYAEQNRSIQEVKFGSAGIGGVTHLPAAMLATKTSFEWVHVPYKGSPPLLQDLMAGRVDAAFTGFSNVLPHHTGGRVRIVAVGSSSRLKSIPNIPTFKELGLQEIGAEYIVMLSAPAGTPREIVNLLASTASSVMQEKELQEKSHEPQGLEPIGSNAADAASYIAADRPVQRERIRVSGAKLDEPGDLVDQAAALFGAV